MYQFTKLIHSSNWRLSRNNQLLCGVNISNDVTQKVQRHDDLIKAHAVR